MGTKALAARGLVPRVDRTAVREHALVSGELGAATAQTVIVALLPLLIAVHAPSALLVGLAVGGEGLFALLLPYAVGLASDRLPVHLAERHGRRMPFLLLAAPVMAATLAVLPFLSRYGALLAAAFACSAALHAYMTPLSAIVVETVPVERQGRVQGFRGTLRALGLAYGFGAAGVLYTLWQPLPFLLATAVVLASTGVTWTAERAGPRATAAGPPLRVREVLRGLKDRPAALWILLANALWNAAIDGIRPYVFLYSKAVLGLGVARTSLGMLVLVLELAVASVLVGRLGDRRDRARLLEASAAVLALTFLAGFFARDARLVVGLVAVAGAGIAAILPLPYPLFAQLAGSRAAGQHAGLFVVSIGIGRLVAPLIVGSAIELGRRWFPEQSGYPMMWLVAAAFAAGGWLAMRRCIALRDR